jgi:uncharacterized protein YbjT (DUF2867 family)
LAFVRILLAGATGLIGRQALDLFLEHPSTERVIAVSRRPLERPPHPKLDARIVEFELLHEEEDLFTVSHIVCALGTTMRQAGDRQAFRRVDYYYPLALARLGLAGGARHFLLVSSLGASTQSRIFYSRVKGEIEDALRKLAYGSLTILRPSVLMGDRAEFRLGERLAQTFARFVPGKYRPIAAHDVAKGLVRAAHEDVPGVRVIESAELRDWAKDDSAVP